MEEGGPEAYAYPFVDVPFVIYGPRYIHTPHDQRRALTLELHRQHRYNTFSMNFCGTIFIRLRQEMLNCKAWSPSFT